MKLIFVATVPVSHLVGEKLSPSWYCDKGLEVEFWDLSRLYYTEQQLEKYFGGSGNYRFRWPKERKFYRQKEVLLAISMIQEKVLFCNVTFGQNNDYWLLRAFSKFKQDYYVGPKRTPLLISAKKNSKSIFSKLATKGLVFKVCKRLSTLLHEVVYNHTSYYQRPIFMVASGKVGVQYWVERTRATKWLSVQSEDVTWNALPQLVEFKYAVFVDDAVAYSPDKFMMEGIQSTCHDLNGYYKNLRRVFEIVEETLGVYVVIAASGKFSYPDSGCFGGREVYYRCTNQLIQHSDLVIGHSSSGLWQCTVDDKPVLLLQDQYLLCSKNNATADMAAFLNAALSATSDVTGEYIKWVMTNIDAQHNQSLIKKYFFEHFGGDNAMDAKEKIMMEITEYFS